MIHKSSIGIQEISAMTNRLKHSWTVKQAWEDGDIYKVYDCVVKILPDLTFQEFDYFQQYRTVFHENFVRACNEIAHCMAGVA
jgi:hypothetical protein